MEADVTVGGRPMSRVYCLLAMALLGGLILTRFKQVVCGQEKEGPNLLGQKNTAGVKATKQADYANKLALAGQLIRYGRQAKAPEALLTAARILHTIPTEKRTEKPKLEEGKQKGNGDTTGRPRDDSPKALVTEVRKMGRE